MGPSISLDATELGIIRLLQEDGRMPTVEIARHLEVSEPTVRKKLARLQNEGLMKVTAIADPTTLGQDASAFIGLDVDRPRIKEVAAALAAYPQVASVVVATGPYDVIIEAAFPTMQHLYDFVLSELTKYEGIQDSHSFLVLQRFKLGSVHGVPSAGGDEVDE